MTISPFGVEHSEIDKSLKGVLQARRLGHASGRISAASGMGTKEAVKDSKEIFPHIEMTGAERASNRAGYVVGNVHQHARIKAEDAAAKVKSKMKKSEFGVEHSTLTKAYPLGSASAWADKTMSEAHAAGEHAERSVSTCRKCKGHGHVKQPVPAPQAEPAKLKMAKSEFGVEHVIEKAGVAGFLGEMAGKAKKGLPGVSGHIATATNKVNDLNGKLRPLAAAVGGVKSTLGFGAKAAKGGAEGAPKTIGQKIATNKGALAAGVGTGVVGSSLLGRKHN